MQVSQEVQSIVERTRALVREVVLPLDDEHDGDIEAASFGPALLLTALNVRYRDFRFVVPFIVQFGLYVSPVGFSSGVVAPEWRPHPSSTRKCSSATASTHSARSVIGTRHIYSRQEMS